MKIQISNTIFTQLLATFGVMGLVTQTGIMDGWTSPNVVRLTDANSTIPMTLSEAAWLASCLKLGRVVSVIFMPIFIDLAGSEKAILYTFIPVSIGWIMTLIAKSAIVLYIARFLNGITYGLTFGCFPIFLGEMSSPKLRGTFTAIAGVGWPLGVLIGTVAETHLSPVVSGTMYLILCFLGIFLFLWLPESPYQLVKNKDLVKARESLVRYRGLKYTDSEMIEIIEFMESTSRVTFLEKMKQLKSSSSRRALVLVTLVFTCPQLCGIFNIFYYMQTILSDSKSHLIETSDVTMYANIILLVSAILSVNLNDKFGRRITVIVSMLLMTVAYVGLGLHYYLLNSMGFDSIRYLPIISVVILIVSFSSVFAPATNALLGELFSANLKSTAAMIANLVAAFVGFISTLAFQPLIDAIGEIYVYWMYAVLVAICLPLILLLLPETKGRSLQEIQNILNKK